MTVAPRNESHGKSVQATFLKVGQNLYRNEPSDLLWINEAWRQAVPYCAAHRKRRAIKDRALAERALRKWLDQVENINPATLTSKATRPNSPTHRALLKKLRTLTTAKFPKWLESSQSDRFRNSSNAD